MLLSMNDGLRDVALGAPALAEEDLLAAQLLLGRLAPGRAGPNGSSFGAGGKSMMFCICAIIATWSARSGRLTPLRVALTWSPLK